MAAAQNEVQALLKLLVDKDKNKVLFAEARKDFVDVLCSFLTLPLGTIVRLVGKDSNMQPVRVGCLTSLYQSVANISEEFLFSNSCKEMLLQPRNSAEDHCRSLKLNIDDTEPTKYLVCCKDYSGGCRSTMLSTFKNKNCRCGESLSKQVPLRSNIVCNGFVNDAAFIITDDLFVLPNSIDTSFELLKSHGLENISSAHEISVNVTLKKVLDLLKCSLLSKTTLTALFLENKPELFLESSKFSLCKSAVKNNIQIRVKLTVRKSSGQIVFAQGEEDFADFLLSFLTFPLGAVVRMFGGYSSAGSIDGLYKSVLDLNESRYLLAKEFKDMLVDPRLAPQLKLSNQMLPIDSQSNPFYHCHYSENLCHLTSAYVFNYYGSSSQMMNLVDPLSTGSYKGFTKRLTTFMVTDDLVVQPTSPISGISFLNCLKIPLDDLTERFVTIGINEGLSILKASLTSTSALTNGLSHLLAEVKEEI